MGKVERVVVILVWFGLFRVQRYKQVQVWHLELWMEKRKELPWRGNEGRWGGALLQCFLDKAAGGSNQGSSILHPCHDIRQVFHVPRVGKTRSFGSWLYAQCVQLLRDTGNMPRMMTVAVQYMIPCPQTPTVGPNDTNSRQTCHEAVWTNRATSESNLGTPDMS